MWIYGFVFQFSLNIVNGSLISYSNDNGNYVEEYAFEAKRSMANRSEERRVGKECRSRWSPYH